MDAQTLLAGFDIENSKSGLKTTSPIDGSLICVVAKDNKSSIDHKVEQALKTQKAWQKLHLKQKLEFLGRFISKVETNKAKLAGIITIDAGKTLDESTAEISNFITTFKDMMSLALTRAEAENQLHQAYLEKTGNLRTKTKIPIGIGGVITSYNFPLSVASWSLAPMLLAGNAVLWKPSEKTPLVALAVKNIFNKSTDKMTDLFQIIIGGRDVGEMMVRHEEIGMISATGSVGMGEGIIKLLERKAGNKAPPILELGGNNGVVISLKNSPENLEKAVDGILHSFLAGGGQKCTNTRRLFIHRYVYDSFIKSLAAKIESFIENGNIKPPQSRPSNKYGYAPLIDKSAFDNYQATVQQALAEGGKLLGGERVLAADYPNAYYLNPALMLMPKQTAVMLKECFAPLLFIAPYDEFEDAVNSVTAPENSGLVNGIYSQSKTELQTFETANASKAGHTAENMPTGTGTPAHRLGFGGKRKSGSGIILDWEGDPFAPFTFAEQTSRVIRNNNVKLDWD